MECCKYEASDGESVEEWQDISGEGKDASAEGSPLFVESSDVFSGPTVEFDGSDSYFAINGISDTN